MIGILLYENNIDFAESLSEILNMEKDLKVLNYFINPRLYARHLEEYNPDVIILDIDMPEMDGITALKDIRKINDKCLILMLTVFDDDDRVFESIHRGANGYLLKETPPAKIIESIRDVVNGGAPMTGSIARRVLEQFKIKKRPVEMYNLSTREREILQFLVKGLSYKMIADECSISYHTVNAHIRKIYEKLHVCSATEAVSKAIGNRLI